MPKHFLEIRFIFINDPDTLKRPCIDLNLSLKTDILTVYESLNAPVSISIACDEGSTCLIDIENHKGAVSM